MSLTPMEEINVIVDELITRVEESMDSCVPTEDLIFEIFPTKRKRSDSLETGPPTPKKKCIEESEDEMQWRLNYPGSPRIWSPLHLQSDSEDEMSCLDTCSCKYCDTKDPTNYGYNSKGQYVYMSDDEEFEKDTFGNNVLKI